MLEEALNVRLSLTESGIDASGEDIDVELAAKVLRELYGLILEGFPLYPSDVYYALRILRKNGAASLKSIFLDNIYIAATKKIIMPKSMQQNGPAMT